MTYVVGIDGGGTKTTALIADKQGNVVSSLEKGPLNYNGQEEAVIQQSIQSIMRAIDEGCGGLEHCAHICLGAAGMSNPVVRAKLEQHIRASGYTGGLTITGDQDTALWGAHGNGFGIILIAGTGSICYGRSIDGQMHRAGGYGYLIDDGGSGYGIGIELLKAVVRAHDGRCSPTILTELVMKQLELSTIAELIGFVYAPSTNKKEIAAIAPLLTVAYEQGDEAASRIILQSAAELFELVQPVAERLKLQSGVVAFTGSVLTHNEQIRSELERQLQLKYPAMTTRLPKHNAVTGAMLMALSQVNLK